MLLHSLLRGLYSLMDKCSWWSFCRQRVQDKCGGMDFSLLPLVMAMGMLAHCISLPPNELCFIPSQLSRGGLAVPNNSHSSHRVRHSLLWLNLLQTLLPLSCHWFLPMPLKILPTKSNFLLNHLHTTHVYYSPPPLQPSFLFSSKFTVFVTSFPRDT